VLMRKSALGSRSDVPPAWQVTLYAKSIQKLPRKQSPDARQQPGSLSNGRP
jgi:hypothetical protein